MTRTVLVTGGGTGIGRAVATAFAADGDNVFITGRRPGPLHATADGLGDRVRALVCDGTDPDQVDAMTTHQPDSVDVLVHGAGGNTDFDRPAPHDLASLAANWRANLDANLLTAVLMTAAISGRLAPGGAVIAIGSIAADMGAGAYGAAKAAVATWNVELAAELGPRQITANIVSPGYVAGTEFFRKQLTDDRRDAILAATLTGRAGTPDDVAGTVHFLAGPAARHITGQVIAVNGGQHTTR